MNGKETEETTNQNQNQNLITISSILTDEKSNLPIKEPSVKKIDENNKETENNENNLNRLRNDKKEKNEEEKKEKSEELSKIKEMGSVTDQITYKEEEVSPDLNDNENGGAETDVGPKEKKVFIKRANIVENDENEKKNDNNNIIPLREINPNELIEIDEEDGSLDYLEAEKEYELSVLLESHKFIKKNKNFDKFFIELVKREIIRYERNLLELKNDKFFILYEVQVSEHIELCLTDIATLNAIKSVFISYPSIHLIIILSDEEYYNKNAEKYDYSLVRDYATEKLANVLVYLDLDEDNEKRIHAFSSKKFKTKNNELENGKMKIKKILDKPKVRKLFNLTTKEEEKNDLLLDYPCDLAVAANPSIYTKFIPEINSEYRCLIINSIFFMNRYLLCFDAAKFLFFNQPAVIALKIVPPLEGVNGREALCNVNGKNTILSSDDKFSLNKKIIEIAYGEENGNNPNVDVPCQYLGFFEKSNDNYYDMIKRFKDRKIDEQEVRNKVFYILKDIFNIFKEKDINNIDTDKIMIN